MSAEQDEAAAVTTPEERAELARLASDMATTPGPWVVPDTDDEYVGPADVVSDGVPGERWIICEHAGADARYIAAANPDTIRRLLADLDAAEARLAAVSALAEPQLRSIPPDAFDAEATVEAFVAGRNWMIDRLRAALTTTPTPAAEVGRREESGR